MNIIRKNSGNLGASHGTTRYFRRNLLFIATLINEAFDRLNQKYPFSID